jgi:hypothetical protein
VWKPPEDLSVAIYIHECCTDYSIVYMGNRAR